MNATQVSEKLIAQLIDFCQCARLSAATQWVVVGGGEPYVRYAGDGRETNIRAVCACGGVCAAGDWRCERCSRTAHQAFDQKEHVERVGVRSLGARAAGKALGYKSSRKASK